MTTCPPRKATSSQAADCPGIVIAGSLMMTNLSAEQLVGTNGQAFAGNMSTMAWEATSAFALIVLAFVFLPKLLRGGIATIPEFFEMRYDTFTMRLFSLLFLIAYVVTMLPTILYSGAVALVKIFDLESMFGISYFSAITIICIGTGIIGMCYAVFGGLKAGCLLGYHQRCRPHHRRLCHPDPRHFLPSASWMAAASWLVWITSSPQRRKR